MIEEKNYARPYDKGAEQQGEPRAKKTVDSLKQRWVQFCREQKLFVEGERVGVACSGGLDSTVLLHLLVQHQQLFRIAVLPVYIDHGTRAGATKAEAQWVRTLSEALGVESFSMKVPSDTKANQQSFRRARYSLLSQFCAQHGVQKIAMAHHADDNAETIMMRMMSGSGLRGMMGIAPRNGVYVRPLLPFSRREILAYARYHRLSWVEDSSNAEDFYLRNRIRHELMPLIEDIREGSTGNMSTLAQRICREEWQWKAWIDQQFSGAANTLPLGWLDKWPTPLQRKILSCWLERLSLEPDSKLVESLLAGTDIVHRQGIFIHRSDMLIFSREAHFGHLWKNLEALELGARITLGSSLAWQFLPRGMESQTEQKALSLLVFFPTPQTLPKLKHSAECFLLDWSILPWPLKVDQLLNRSQEACQMLKKAGIPQPYWDRWPVVVSVRHPNTVVAVVGLGPLRDFQTIASERVLCFRILKD